MTVGLPLSCSYTTNNNINGINEENIVFFDEQPLILPNTSEDTQMKFSLAPSQGDKGFQQWKDAICVASRMPNGVPPPVRQKLWISLASNYIREIRLDWNKIRKFAFNNCANSDDDELGIQIVKDLHRTGCSWSDNEHDRSTLKRVLLAFARYNKSIGYCQGLNILTAVILEVVDKNEEDALMVLIYLVDKILPDGFFTNNLRALAIDMAVFREWLRIYNVKLHNHLHQLQISSKDASGTIYEPPLLNVFTIQWFLTLFATCLPRPATLRVWDALLLEGSEVLFRTGLVIWSKLAISVLKVQSADQFYSAMGLLSVQLLDEKIIDVDNLIRDIYAFGPFPTSILSELRQKFSFNITPFQQLSSSNNVADRTSMKSQQKDGQILMDINGLSTRHGDYKSSTVTKRSLNNTQNHGTDEETAADEEIVNFMSCFSILASSSRNRLEHNSPEQSWANSANSNSVVLSRVTPGAYSNVPETHKTNSIEDSLSLDINQLHRQYKKLRERQKQAQIIMQTASAEQRNRSRASSLHPNDSRRVGPPPTPTLKSTRKTDDLSSGTISDATLSSTNVSNNKNTSPLTKQHSTVCSIKGGPLINHLLLKAADPKRNMYKKNVSIKAPVSTIQNTRSNSIVDSTKYTYPDTPSTETSKHEKKQVLSEDDTVEEDVDIQIEIEQLLTSLNLERPVIQKSVPKITTKQPIDDENSSTTDNETENRLENIARTLYDYQKTQNLSETDSDSKNSNIFASKQRNGSIMGRLLTTNPNGPRYSSFNPFPSRSFNENVAMNGYKLGLYAPR
ncbi:unnamed protein product [Didymodactylos carnosus]|uniref:Rab-GAP TBC domain-containing protein n=1 Tax=Didymodactylos carnosus TaxID=1234261 RepID=A0A8S2MQU1_9BILA|nr:unnamed protein product [Didymodactylos carnosus]CAF3968590.1 unnamed protein product [Didymodactylos carnosus]